MIDDEWCCLPLCLSLFHAESVQLGSRARNGRVTFVAPLLLHWLPVAIGSGNIGATTKTTTRLSSAQSRGEAKPRAAGLQ